MSPILLDVAHIPQRDRSDCLVACAAMVFAFKQIRMRYRRMTALLKTQWYGTPFSNLAYLKRANLNVQIVQGDPTILYTFLQNNEPIILPVATQELPYHTESTDHAIVVVGFDDNYFYVNDPMFAAGNIPVPKGDLELAWLAHDERYAVIVQR